jgi:hypothetical protein
VLLQRLDDLLFRESALTHVRLPGNGLYPKLGAFKGSRSAALRDVACSLTDKSACGWW